VNCARPSRWGNIWRIGMRRVGGFEIKTAQDAVTAYRDSIEIWWVGDPAFLAPLKGKNLACWCQPDQPCHCDVLLEIANA
jgi:hypothetical protein